MEKKEEIKRTPDSERRFMLQFPDQFINGELDNSARSKTVFMKHKEDGSSSGKGERRSSNPLNEVSNMFSSSFKVKRDCADQET